MSAGQLRHRVELKRKTPTVTDFENVVTWTTYATVWAQKLEPKGREVTEALQVEGKLTVTFRIRYRSDVSVEDRLVFDGRDFDITLPTNPDGRKRWLMLHCTEHRSDGD